MFDTTVAALDLLDQVLARATESVWSARVMPRHHVAAWFYDHERLVARLGGEQDPAVELLGEVLEQCRDAVDAATPMDGDVVDRWRTASFELRDDLGPRPEPSS